MSWRRITEREYYEWSDKLRSFFEATGLEKICSGMCKGSCCQRIGCARCVVIEDEEEPLSCLSFMCRRLKEDIVRSLTSIAKRGTSKIKSIAKEAADIILGAFDYGSFVYTQLKVSPYGYESYNLYPADFGWNSAMYITMEGLNFIENIDRILPIVAEASADLAKSCKKFDYDKCSCAEKFSLSIYPHRFNLITFMKRNELKMFVCDMLSLEELIQTALDRAKPYINRLDFEHITPIISDLKYSIFGINMLENYKKYVKNKEECWHGI